jgi:hypothetical protein
MKIQTEFSVFFRKEGFVTGMYYVFQSQILFFRKEGFVTGMNHMFQSQILIFLIFKNTDTYTGTNN